MKKKYKKENDFEDDFEETPHEDFSSDNEENDDIFPESQKDDLCDEYEFDEPEKKETKKVSRKKADKEKFYVEPKEFDQEIINYYDTGVMSDNLAQMVSKIAHKLSFAPNFINYTYREEMVGDGIIRMFKALTSKKYDRVKGTNPFSYFTRIAFNAFRNRIKKEKHLRDTLEKYQNELLFFSQNYNTIIKNNQIKISQNKHHE